MSTIIDKYGREIDVQTDVVTQTIEGVVTEDVYTLDGVAVWLPAGTPESVALATIEAMAPAWWVPPPPPEEGEPSPLAGV
jgi:hypothetical protein